MFKYGYLIMVLGCFLAGCSHQVQDENKYSGYWERTDDSTKQLEIKYDHGNFYVMKFYDSNPLHDIGGKKKIVEVTATSGEGKLIVAGPVGELPVVILENGQLTYGGKVFIKQSQDEIAASKMRLGE